MRPGEKRVLAACLVVVSGWLSWASYLPTASFSHPGLRAKVLNSSDTINPRSHDTPELPFQRKATTICAECPSFVPKPTG